MIFCATDDVNKQCVVACQDLFNPLMYYEMDTLEDTRFPSGAPCVAEGDTRGYCHFGKCIDESKFEMSLYRTTQQGDDRPTDRRNNQNNHIVQDTAYFPAKYGETIHLLTFILLYNEEDDICM